jgi:MFS family permease
MNTADHTEATMNQGAVATSDDLRPEKGAHGIVAPWLIWGVSAVFVLFQFFLQLSSGEIIDGLMNSFSLSAFGGGILASAYYYIYTILQTPAGVMIDRFGPRRLLTAGAIVCALGCFTFGASHYLLLAVMGRLMMGAGAAFAFVGSLNVIAKWFPVQRFALMAAIAETVGMMGTIVGGFFLAELVQNVGWRFSMVGAAGLALGIGVLIALVVRDKPRYAAPVSTRPRGALWQDFKALVSNKVAWVNGLYSGTMFSVVTVFVALWAIPYIQLAHHISLTKATLICNLLFAGVAVGGPIIGWLDGRIHQRRALLMICALISAALLSVVIFVPSLSLSMLMVSMTLLGFFCSTYVVTFGVANDIVLPHMRGTSMGFLNTLSVGCAPLLQPIVGLILHLTVHHHGFGADHYSVGNYETALSILPVVVLSAAWLGWYVPGRK